MPDKVLLTEMDGTPEQIAFANFAGDFSPSTNNDLRVSTPITVELVLLNLLNAAAAQSAIVDLGVNFAERYSCDGLIEMQVAAADDGEVVEAWWASSPSGTAAVANKGAVSGVASAYTGYSADLATAIKQLTFIGNMTMTDDTVDSAQIGEFGELYPTHRFGSLVIRNLSGQTICDTDDIEAHIVLNPVIPEIQTA